MMIVITIPRVSITCACSMHLALFPLDEQKCDLDVASCEHQKNHGNDGNDDGNGGDGDDSGDRLLHGSGGDGVSKQAEIGS